MLLIQVVSILHLFVLNVLDGTIFGQLTVFSSFLILFVRSRITNLLIELCLRCYHLGQLHLGLKHHLPVFQLAKYFLEKRAELFAANA